jgi:FkbM family methyltransferase
MTPQRKPRGVLSFYVHSLWHLVRLRIRVALNRDQNHEVGGFPFVLPPGHRLSWFQSLFPDYDRYALPLLRELCQGSRNPALIDIGANVGDTTLLALASVPQIHVKAVEGEPTFLKYLRRNVAAHGDAVTIVDRFVETDGSADLSYEAGRSTGGFKRTATGSGGVPAGVGVRVADLLTGLDDNDLVVWKSDTDGLDLSILLSAWDSILRRCDVVWFEFDPFLDVAPEKHLPDLYARIASIDRTMLVYDNTGRRMLTVDSACAPDVLAGLTAWMERSAVPGDTSYLDVWLIAPALTRDGRTLGSK